MDKRNRAQRGAQKRKKASQDETEGIQLQFLCCSSAFVGSLVSGLSSSCKRVHYSTYGSKYDRDYIYYMPMVGDAVGIFVAALSVYIFGRKAALAITNILLFLPLAILISKIDAQWDFTGIVLLQAAVRHQAVAISVYTAEITSPQMRGLFISLCVPLFVTGTMFSEYLMSYRLVVVFATTLSLGTIMLDLYQVSETPYWLALVGERDKAQELFARLRAGTEFKTEGEATLNLAELDAEDKQYGLLRLLADADFVEPLALILCMNLATESACQLVFAALNTPNEYFKYETLLRDLSDQIPRAVVLWVPIVATLLMPLVVRFVGRRYIYFGTLVISYGLLVGYMLSKNQENVRPWMEYSCFLALHLGGRQVALILPTEIFPGVIRPFGVAANEFFQLSLHVADFYLLRNTFLNNSPYLLIRILFMVLGLILFLRFVPETKDLSLVETEELGSHVWSRVLLEEISDGYGDEIRNQNIN